MAINTEHFKQKLELEKKALEAELVKVGRKNPDNPSDWEAVPSERDVSQADENTVADGITEYEENNAILNTLESRYKDIRSGLDKIAKGVYGTCQVCKKEIEEERLEANPAARTCMEHMN
ncbi:MAG: TraR/DksA family transcriptional regulator [Parcubacteria group bacterium]|nr:TraR/DksA family transcriptional regulator [Parcubacteria group bacterium]